MSLPAVKKDRIHSALARRQRRFAWTFLAPMLLLLALVAIWPLLRTIWFGFTDAGLGSPADYHLVGIDNYLHYEDGAWYGLLADPLWWRASWNTLYFTVVSVSLETAFGLVVALVLHQSFRGRGWVRAAVLVPWAMPTIVSAKMWGWMLHDQFGIINDILVSSGVINAPLAWTADPDLAMSAVILVDVWKTTPFMALLILAALQMLPDELYESARLDGVRPVKVFFRITLPLIRPALLVAIIFRALDAMRIFDLIFVLTSNSEDTMSMSVFARQQLIDFQDVGYGSAAATLLFVTIALLTVIILMIGRVRPGDRTGNRDMAGP